MKKIAVLLFACSFFIFSCGKTKTVPVTEKIKKNWTASTVKEGSAIVYSKGAANNTKPGYSSFQLRLLLAPAVTLIEFDGNTFSGQYEVVGDTKLVLKNLSPVPTGTGGTIEFTIDSINDTQLILTRTSASQKTGNTINTYTLVTQ
ncbi:hypothetical protein [Emticicia sp. 17c]|uniref:hypothetical protein n=1 Tax=Emticicia sp. 17c TaxID=3127704 RepID=UPI00301CA490